MKTSTHQVVSVELSPEDLEKFKQTLGYYCELIQDHTVSANPYDFGPYYESRRNTRIQIEDEVLKIAQKAFDFGRGYGHAEGLEAAAKEAKGPIL